MFLCFPCHFLLRSLWLKNWKMLDKCKLSSKLSETLSLKKKNQTCYSKEYEKKYSFIRKCSSKCCYRPLTQISLKYFVILIWNVVQEVSMILTNMWILWSITKMQIPSKVSWSNILLNILNSYYPVPLLYLPLKS